MSRWWGLSLLGFIALGVGCNAPVCGPGTKQVQQPGGDLRCVAVDQPAQLTDCDIDGGNVQILGGKCVSKISCDPATTMFDPNKNQCVGLGTVVGCTPCPTPDTGKICLTGNLVDFVTNTPLTPGQKSMRVALYEPLAFLSNPNAPPLVELASTDKGCFTFNNVDPPGTGLIAIAVGDPAGSPATYQLAGTALTIQADKTYNVGAYIVPKTVVAAWTATTSIDYAMKGAYISFFYDGPVPDSTDRTIPTAPLAAGVNLKQTISAPGTPKYFGPTRDAINVALTATGALGGLIADPGSGEVGSFSGLNGTCVNGAGSHACKWETHPGGTAPGVMLFDRFFDCTSTPTAPSCQ